MKKGKSMNLIHALQIVTGISPADYIDLLGYSNEKTYYNHRIVDRAPKWQDVDKLLRVLEKMDAVLSGFCQVSELPPSVRKIAEALMLVNEARS